MGGEKTNVESWKTNLKRVGTTLKTAREEVRNIREMNDVQIRGNNRLKRQFKERTITDRNNNQVT